MMEPSYLSRTKDLQFVDRTREIPKLQSSAPSSFLFINKNPSSTSWSINDEPGARPAISRHVNQWHNEQVRNKRRASHQCDAKRTEMIVGWLRGYSDNPVPLRVATSSKKTSAQRLPATSASETTSDTTETHITKERNPAHRHQALALPHDDLDSFACAGVRMDAWTHRILQYFIANWNISWGCVFEGPLSVSSGKVDSASQLPVKASSMEVTMQRCFSHEMHMYAALAFGACRMKFVTRDQLQHSHCPERLMAKAIQLLREHLSNPPDGIIDQQVLVDFVFLAIFESQVGAYTGADQNSRSYFYLIKSLVDRLGGFDQVEGYVWRFVWYADLFLALAWRTTPVFAFSRRPKPFPRYVWAQFEEEISLEKTIAVNYGVQPRETPEEEKANMVRTWMRLKEPCLGQILGSSFGKHQDIVNFPLRVLIDDLITCAQVVKSFPIAERDKDKQWIFEQAGAIMHRLVSIPTPQGEPTAEQLRSDCMRITLILWDSLVLIGCAAGSDFPLTARPIFTNRLMQTISRSEEKDPGCWDEHCDLLFWMVGHGLSIAVQGPVKDWFVTKFLHLAKLLEIRSTDQISTLYGGFLYLDEFERSSVKNLAAFLV